MEDKNLTLYYEGFSLLQLLSDSKLEYYKKLGCLDVMKFGLVLFAFMGACVALQISRHWWFIRKNQQCYWMAYNLREYKSILIKRELLEANKEVYNVKAKYINGIKVKLLYAIIPVEIIFVMMARVLCSYIEAKIIIILQIILVALIISLFATLMLFQKYYSKKLLKHLERLKIKENQHDDTLDKILLSLSKNIKSILYAYENKRFRNQEEVLQTKHNLHIKHQSKLKQIKNFIDDTKKDMASNDIQMQTKEQFNNMISYITTIIDASIE